MGKYYAVKEGKKPGIYTTWEDCKANIDKFPGAVYKSFLTLQEAESYLDAEESLEEIDLNKPYAFIDGSYSKKNNCYGYGGYISLNAKKYLIQGKGNKEGYLEYRNIAGETRGALEVMQMAIKLGIKEIYIYYDYAGIKEWACNNWSCSSVVAKTYKAFYDKYSQVLKVTFIHVKGHTGIEGNELADLIAKEAVGATSVTKKQLKILEEFKREIERN